MQSRFVLTALKLTGALAGAMAVPIAQASAERVNVGSPKANAAFTACSNAGGEIQEAEGVTSCIAGNGHGIVCGGTPGAIAEHPDFKGTCDTFRRAPKTPWKFTAEERPRVKLLKLSDVVKPTKPVKRAAP